MENTETNHHHEDTKNTKKNKFLYLIPGIGSETI